MGILSKSSAKKMSESGAYHNLKRQFGDKKSNGSVMIQFSNDLVHFDLSLHKNKLDLVVAAKLTGFTCIYPVTSIQILKLFF